ncbi:MAG: preprotein translocase subunit SecY [Bradymonadaceae bacterium]
MAEETNFADIPKVPELRKRLLFTLGVLALYRVGVFITVPGVNRTAMQQMMGGGGGFFSLMNLFTGGALKLMSVFALGVMPYISASIIMQLMTVVVPEIERLQNDEGERGRRKVNQYTRYFTLLIGVVQGFFISMYLENMHQTNPGAGLLVETGWAFRLTTILTLAAGTILVMWMGEQIDEFGIGNGISLIITASIMSRFPGAVMQTYQKYDTGGLSTFSVLGILVVALAVTGFIVWMESAQRRIPLQYAKRMVGKRIYGGQQHHLPLKVNMAGVIPPIFASSLLIFPTTIASYFQGTVIAQQIQQILRPGNWQYNVIYSGLIIFFTYFYTAVQVNPVDIADNLKKSGAFVPGIRPGKKTADYIDDVLTRLTTAGSVYLAGVCVMPFFLQDFLNVSFYFGGISLVITVSVGLRTVQEIENYLISRQYDDFSAKVGQTGDSGGISGRND